MFGIGRSGNWCRAVAIFAAMLLSVISVSACGVMRDPRDVQLAVLRPVHYDYIQFVTPEALAAFVDVVAYGEVETFAQGLMVEAADRPGPERYVVMSVKLRMLLKGSSESAHRGSIYVALRQGVGADLKDFGESLPSGTPVIMFLRQLDIDRLSSGPDRVIGSERGRPQGSVLYEPYPQGLVFARDGHVVGGIDDLPGEGTVWADLSTLDDVIERLVVP